MRKAIRPAKSVAQSRPTVEGAGVRLRRAFGFGEPSEFDPFLLFDDFRNDRSEDFAAGFPWHPHRGIETITYVLAGTVEHEDSIGNHGALGPGDVQWMTAGRGIIHQEMPRGDEHGRMHGFQLWANLPAKLKMTAPRYQEFRAAEIPEVGCAGGGRVRVLCGSFAEIVGPVEGIAADPTILDISMPPKSTQIIPVPAASNAFAYVFQGSGRFGAAHRGGLTDAADRTLVHFGDGDEVRVETAAQEVRFLLAAGRPIAEPVAWRGPIVMNTDAELRRAFAQLDDGTFLEQNGATT